MAGGGSAPGGGWGGGETEGGSPWEEEKTKKHRASEDVFIFRLSLAGPHVAGRYLSIDNTWAINRGRGGKRRGSTWLCT